jgi:hypothetical protein
MGKFIIDNMKAVLQESDSKWEELTAQDKSGKIFRVYASQFSHLALEWQDDFENWELGKDIVSIKDLTVNENEPPRPEGRGIL